MKIKSQSIELCYSIDSSSFPDFLSLVILIKKIWLVVPKLLPTSKSYHGDAKVDSKSAGEPGEAMLLLVPLPWMT